MLNDSNKKVIVDVLRGDLKDLESLIQLLKGYREKAYQLSDKNTEGGAYYFKELNCFKNELRKLRARKKKLVSAIVAIKTL